MSGNPPAPSFIVPSSQGGGFSVKEFVPRGPGATGSHPAPQSYATGSTKNVLGGLIEGDDALGMSSTGEDGSSMAAQAAAMFRASQPFGPASSTGHQRNSSGVSRGSIDGMSGVPNSTGFATRGLHTAGRGHHESGGGERGGMSHRGRGRGRRGGGQHYAITGPGMNRPSITTFAVTPGVRRLIAQFAPDTLVQSLQQQNYLMAALLDDETKKMYSMPETIQSYHSLCPLENVPPALQQPSKVFSVPSLCLKATHSGDGAAYMLRRLDGRHVVPTPEILDKCSEVVRKWSPLANHPNLVGFRDAFVSEEMLSVPSLYLTFDYHPAACSLEQIYITPSQGGHKARLSEEELWSYLVQMTGALRTIHSAGLDLGPSRLAPSKILLCSPGRIRIGSVGVGEILHGSTSPMGMMTAQLLDLEALGHLILTLASAARNVGPTLDNLILHYSRELCHIVAGLIAAPKGNGFQNWKSLAVALGDRVFDELEASFENVDTLSMGMLKECENGRIARFLIKLNAIVDRAEFLGDTRWAETGDRYLLKLFRDFIFHQVDEQGLPMNDWGVIIDAINKADSGIEEKIMLLSRDEASMLVVSYADIKRCLISAYAEIKRNSAPVK
eukprot:jgi/Picsp_1/572/NSC_00569-R1_pan3 polya specific ribonuclease subunit homolog ( cerevisiae)